jgi:3-dehydroquinate dehydratase-1
MGKVLRIRNLAIGDGIPKICVSLMGASMGELLPEAKRVLAAGADLAEWRVDYFSDAGDTGKVVAALHQLRVALAGTPILATFRTAPEGGARRERTLWDGIAAAGDAAGYARDGATAAKGAAAISSAAKGAAAGAANAAGAYVRLLLAIAKSGEADALDVELSAGAEEARRVIGAARLTNTLVVASSHNFDTTPHKIAIMEQLGAMHALGADIAKIAAMPSNFGDVLTLMGATYEYVSRAGAPVIAMSMGELGALSRVSGGLFGSAVTFCSLGRASAPGQLSVADAKAALNILSVGLARS